MLSVPKRCQSHPLKILPYYSLSRVCEFDGSKPSAFTPGENPALTPLYPLHAPTLSPRRTAPHRQLEILSQAKDPQAVQPHLRKCFDNLVGLTFGDEPGSIDIHAMISSEGEKVPLGKNLKARGYVEDWLSQVRPFLVALRRGFLLPQMRKSFGGRQEDAGVSSFSSAFAIESLVIYSCVPTRTKKLSTTEHSYWSTSLLHCTL